MAAKRTAAVGRDVDLWQRAASFAAWKHQHQNRKDGVTPYFAHPARVALTVSQVFGCDDAVALAAALLHDTIEDTTTDYDDLRERFGAEVAACVGALTKNATLPERQREREYDARLLAAPWQAKLVKLADVFDNYVDGESTPPAVASSMAKRREKCRRAVAIAKADTSGRPELAAAIRVVSRLAAKG